MSDKFRGFNRCFSGSRSLAYHPTAAVASLALAGQNNGLICAGEKLEAAAIFAHAQEGLNGGLGVLLPRRPAGNNIHLHSGSASAARQMEDTNPTCTVAWWPSVVLCSGGLTERSLLSPLQPPRWPSGKVSASRAEDPGFESRLCRDFSGTESYR